MTETGILILIASACFTLAVVLAACLGAAIWKYHEYRREVRYWLDLPPEQPKTANGGKKDTYQGEDD